MASGTIATSNGKNILVSTVTLTISNVPANGVSSADHTASAAKTGYTPLGIVGYNITASICPFRLYLRSGTIHARFRNLSSSAVDTSATIYVLYEEA